MGMTELGRTIANQRKKRGMTQKELSKGVCSQPALSLIEKGKSLPSLENIFLISIKLKKPVELFLLCLTEDTEYDQIYQTTSSIDNLIKFHDFEAIYSISSKELTKRQGKNSWYDHYLSWVYFMSKYRLNLLSYKETIYNLKSLLNSDNSLAIEINGLSLKIINSIAFVHSENKSFQEALKYYDKGLNKVDNAWTNDNDLPLSAIRIKFLFNKVKTLYDMGQYQDAIFHAKNGIEESKKSENMSLIGHFFYYIGQCYEKENREFEDIAEMYSKAEFFFVLLDREKLLNILYELKSDFLTNKDSKKQ